MPLVDEAVRASIGDGRILQGRDRYRHGCRRNRVGGAVIHGVGEAAAAKIICCRNVLQLASIDIATAYYLSQGDLRTIQFQRANVLQRGNGDADEVVAVVNVDEIEVASEEGIGRVLGGDYGISRRVGCVILRCYIQSDHTYGGPSAVLVLDQCRDRGVELVIRVGNERDACQGGIHVGHGICDSPHPGARRVGGAAACRQATRVDVCQRQGRRNRLGWVDVLVGNHDVVDGDRGGVLRIGGGAGQIGRNWGVIDVGNGTDCTAQDRFQLAATVRVGHLYGDVSPNVGVHKRVAVGGFAADVATIPLPLIAECAQPIRIAERAGVRA